jgi:RNA polymerase sigma-70 factor, ECF subfamily
MALEDEELVSACLEGRKEAWDEFVGRFSKLIYWSITRTVEKQPFGGVEELCEEVFQEVFRKLLEKEELSKLRDAKNIRKFLSVIACHAAMDKLKSLGRYERKNVSPDLGSLFPDGDEIPASLGLEHESPADLVLSREKDALIEETLGGLSPKERSCVEMHYLDGRTHQEIGVVLGLSQDTVSTVIRRAKDKLRKDFLKKGLSG